MNLQNKVYKMGTGSAGQIAKGLHSYFMAFHSPALDDSVKVGSFVQLDTNGKFIKGTSQAITGDVVGVALKDQFISSIGNTQFFNKNDIVTYISKGCVFIETKVPAKVGQYVFLKNDTGDLVFDNTNTKENHTYTGFKVVLGTGDAVNADMGFDIIAILSE